jgi:sortase B
VEKRDKGKKKAGRSIWSQVLLVICLAVMAVSGYMLYAQLAEYHAGRVSYDKLAQEINPEKAKTEWPDVDFDSLKAINPDIAGWLICEDTSINYPVVQGRDNSYYLNHLFDGTVNKAGCLFIDYQNTPGFADQNTIIHGHNMKNKTMFSALTKYKDQEFYEKHRRMKLLTEERNYFIELFAGYVTDQQDNAWQIGFADEDGFKAWIKQAVARSTFRSDVAVGAEDRVVTLSTCSYEFDDARYVLFGKLVPVDAAS